MANAEDGSNTETSTGAWQNVNRLSAARSVAVAVDVERLAQVLERLQVAAFQAA